MAEKMEVTPLTLTEDGLRLQAKVQTGLTKLNLVKVIIGYGFLDETESPLRIMGVKNEIPSRQTGDSGSAPTVDISRLFQDDEEAMSLITVTVQNGDNDFTYCREFLFLALDSTTDETIKYAYANLGENGLPLPKYNGKSHVTYNIDFPTAITNVADVELHTTFVSGTPWDEFMKHVNNTNNPHKVTATQTGAIPIGEKGAANGVAELDASGKVPSTQLPSYVDDVLNGTAQGVTETGAGTYSATGFILVGQTNLCMPEDGKTYIDTATNIQYRWTGTVFVSMGSNLALGETSRTAGRGDWTKAAYDHSQQEHAPTTAATQSDTGLMSAADKKKLDGIESGAQVHKAPTSAEITTALGYMPEDKTRADIVISKLAAAGVLIPTSWDDVASLSITLEEKTDDNDTERTSMLYHNGTAKTIWGEHVDIATATSGSYTWGTFDRDAKKVWCRLADGKIYIVLGAAETSLGSDEREPGDASLSDVIKVEWI